MIIGIDGHSLLSPTLASRFTFEFIESLATEYPGDIFNVYVTRLKRDSRFDNLRRYHNISFRLPAQSGFHGHLWRLFGVTNNLEADKTELFHGPAGRLPLNISSSHIPSVVTILEKDIEQNEGRTLNCRIKKFITSQACRTATRIIVDTSEGKEKLCRIYGIESTKTDIIPIVGSSREMSAQVMECYKKASLKP